VSRWRSATAAALLAVLATPLAGCGGDSEERSEPLPPGVAAAAPTGPAADDPPAAVAPTEPDARPSADEPEPEASTFALERTARASRPPRWPRTLQIGLVDPEDNARTLRDSAPFGVRWHYLSGGAATSASWTNWRMGAGSFVTAYVEDSRTAKTIPFFSYYVLQETPPASNRSDEQDKVVHGLENPLVVRRVVGDLRRALQRLGGAGGPAVLQIEPDMWATTPRTRRSGCAASTATPRGCRRTYAASPGWSLGCATPRRRTCCSRTR
jgi:hypothetical protein